MPMPLPKVMASPVVEVRPTSGVMAAKTRKTMPQVPNRPRAREPTSGVTFTSGAVRSMFGHPRKTRVRCRRR